MNAPIKKVTLLEDRAYISRLASVDLNIGSVRLEFGPVTPVLSDKTVLVEIAPEHRDKVTLREMRVLRKKIELPEEEERLLEEILGRQSQLSTLLETLQAEKRELERLQEMLLQEIAEDAAWGRGDSEQWKQQLSRLREEELSLGARRRQALLELEESSEELARHRAKLERQKLGQVNLEAVIEVLLEVTEACRVNLSIEYCVPGACWRPYHRAHFREGKLKFTSLASVWQNTGEDWSDVELFLSTQRTAQTTALPRLVADHISLQDKATEIILETREEQVDSLDPGLQRLVKELPGIDDQGDTFLLKAPALFSLESKGQSSRADLFHFETTCELRHLARPELLSQVVIQSSQINLSEHPLLPGPVELARGPALLGSSWLEYTAPGSPFKLDWGPESSLSLKRSVEDKEEKKKILQGWVTSHRRVNVYLSNLGTQEFKVLVSERVPVSETSDLEVELNRTKTSQGSKPDENGFVHWEVALKAHQREKLSLFYTLKRKKSSSLSGV